MNNIISPNTLDTITYLKQISKFGSESKVRPYSTIEQLVLKCGENYKPSLRPPRIKKAPDKECFSNAYHLAMENKNYLYVEGFATNIIPTLHAWVVDSEDNVIDNTWEEVGTSYRGIKFTDKQISTIIAVRGIYGALDDYRNGFPALRISNFTPQRLTVFYLKLYKQ